MLGGVVTWARAQRPAVWFGSAGAVLAVALVVAGYVWLAGGTGWSHRPTQYTYRAVVASNGVELHTMKTSPRNTRLTAIASNVTDTLAYGINGGFFYNGDLLSIAVQDDRPAGTERGAFGSGWANAK